MTEFLQVFSSVTFVLFIVTSVIFGISLGVKHLVNKTAKNLIKESTKNFDKIDDIEKKATALEAVEQAKRDCYIFLQESKVINKRIRRQKMRKFFKLNYLEIDKPEVFPKEVFFNLLKGASAPFTDETAKNEGYLSFTADEIFHISRTLTKRLEEILDASKIIWLKTLKLSYIVEATNVINALNDVLNKPGVVVLVSIINFFMWIAKLFNPVSASKYLINNASDDLGTVIYLTLIEIAGKEIAKIYCDKEQARIEEKVKVA